MTFDSHFVCFETCRHDEDIVMLSDDIANHLH